MPPGLVVLSEAPITAILCCYTLRIDKLFGNHVFYLYISANLKIHSTIVDDTDHISFKFIPVKILPFINYSYQEGDFAPNPIFN